MRKAILYLTGTRPGEPTFVDVYDIYDHTAAGIRIKNGCGETVFYPAHRIEKVKYL
jgi:hypothetical protein